MVLTKTVVVCLVEKLCQKNSCFSDKPKSHAPQAFSVLSKIPAKIRDFISSATCSFNVMTLN